MKITVKEIAKIIDGEYSGNPDLIITGASGIKEAGGGDISFLSNKKYAALINDTKASCLIVASDMNISSEITCIRTNDPSLAFAKVVQYFHPDKAPRHPSGIHPTASVSKKAVLGKNVSLGPHVVIEVDAKIGDNAIIYAGVYVGHKSVIGKDTLIYSNASIREDVTIGNRVIIHNGAVIGSDGFGFATVEGTHQKIPQVGTVIVEDDVEIGANVTVDRARFGRTLIGKGSKIDNLVQIAHNVEIGEGTIVVAQAGISGSTKIGKNVILAGQSGIVGHIEIGDNTIVAAGAGVIKSVDSNQVVLGSPAKPHNFAKRIFACIDRLPELFKKIATFDKRIKKLEKETEWKNNSPLKSA